jgi:hypothetical protein
LPEFQPPQPNKCGTWAPSPGKTLFDYRGQPAVYIPTAPGGTQILVCGQTVSVSVQTTAIRTKDALILLLNTFPFDQIETRIGVKK